MQTKGMNHNLTLQKYNAAILIQFNIKAYIQNKLNKQKIIQRHVEEQSELDLINDLLS